MTDNEKVPDKEEKFLNFCKEEEIPVKLESSSPEGKTYSITILSSVKTVLRASIGEEEVQGDYLDGVEKRVVEFCKKNGIKFTYKKDSSGNHHYNFSRLIDFTENYSNPPYYGTSPHLSRQREPLCFSYKDKESSDKKVTRFVKKKRLPRLRNLINKMWKKLCLLCETSKKREERETLEFIKSLGHSSKEEFLRIGLPKTREEVRRNNSFY